MAVFELENFVFEELDDFVRFWFMKYFYFDVFKQELENIGSFVVSKDKIEFVDVSEKRASNKFFLIIEKGWNSLKNSLNNRHNSVTYVYSGIPLIGTRFFGIIDRGSSMIEVKPLTSCNINCIYCSVDEGVSSKKVNDFLVDKDYLVQELNSLIDFKVANGFNDKFDIYINPHGEPLLYADIVSLVEDLRNNSFVGEIHIITNGTLLSEELIDSLVSAGLTHFNVSISSFDNKNSKFLAGSGFYDVDFVKKMVVYASKKCDVIVAPVYIPSFNDKDLEDVVIFCRDNNISCMIQNFLENKRGRCPVKQKSWDDFYSFLDGLEKKFGVSLKGDFSSVVKSVELPYPFKKNDVVKADIVCPSRYKNECIAVSCNRCIDIVNYSFVKKENKKVKIVNCKNNLFKAVV